MSTLRRQVKNVIKNYTEAEVKVREATSNDPWGPSSTLMSEISDLTYNIVALGDIMRMIWKRLNDHGKNWRHVYKSLVLLDYLIKNGNEKVAQQCKEHIVAVQTLKDFQYVEENRDQGVNVREKSKQIVAILRDDERLRQERVKALKSRERMSQSAMAIHHVDGPIYSNVIKRPPLSQDIEAVRPSNTNEEQLQVSLALALSKQEHEEELKRKINDEIKVKLAIDESITKKQQENSLLDLSSDDSADLSTTTVDPWSEFITPAHLLRVQKIPTTTIQVNSKPPVVAPNDPWSSFSNPWATAFDIKPIDGDPLKSVNQKIAAEAAASNQNVDEFEQFMNRRILTASLSAPPNSNCTKNPFW